MTDKTPVVVETSLSAYREPNQIGQRREFFESTPREQVIQATEIANVLSSIIEKQNLYSNIQGKKYIKAEGWQTLGTFLGVVTREKSVVRHEDGTYEAYIEIVKFRDGTVVGGASAICSRKEKRWANADEYAVRSMAITRAMGKAFRTSFAWIVTLAGYAPTNAEEMPEVEIKPSTATRTVIYSSPEQTPAAKPASTGYDPLAKNHQDVMIKVLQSKGVPDHLWDDVGNKMKGLSFDKIGDVIKSVMASQPKPAQPVTEVFSQ